jgi:hypothetical protein
MIQNLQKSNGKYLGEGINHEGQPFKAALEILAKPEINGASFTFEARGNTEQLFHFESSLVGKNLRGETALWILSSNHPGIFERTLKTEEKTPHGIKYIFAFGEKNNRNTFREEVHLELQENSLRYIYFWGLPGGDFAERSGCVMKLIV